MSTRFPQTTEREQPRARLLTLVALALVGFATGWLLLAAWSRIGLMRRDAHSAVTAQDLARRSWSTLASRGSAFGEQDSPAQLVVILDYECEECRANSRLIDSLAEITKLRVRYLHVPNRFTHPIAESAARAAVCAEVQGRFAEIHRQLVRTDAWIADHDWSGLAAVAGVPDMDRFLGCLRSVTTDLRLLEDRRWVRELSIGLAPSFIVNGRSHRGIVPATLLHQLSSSNYSVVKLRPASIRTSGDVGR